MDTYVGLDVSLKQTSVCVTRGTEHYKCSRIYSSLRPIRWRGASAWIIGHDCALPACW